MLVLASSLGKSLGAHETSLNLIQKENGLSSWFGFSLILDGPLSGQRSRLLSIMKDLSIQARPIVAGNFARNPVMKHLDYAELPSLANADRVHFDGLFVGNHHYSLTKELELLHKALDLFSSSK